MKKKLVVGDVVMIVEAKKYWLFDSMQIQFEKL